METAHTRSPLAALEALACVPGSEVEVFARSQEIYAPGDTTGNLYRLLEGRVKLARMAGSRITVVVDICQPGDFFGESALLNVPRGGEQAVALEPVRAMRWSKAALSESLAADPRLAFALIQVVAKRCLLFKDRLESLSVDDTSHRLGRVLIDFAGRASGASGSDVTIEPITHEILAQYIGTSREIVSHQMGSLRKRGYIAYSRKGILVHRDLLADWLAGNRKAQHA